MKKGFQRLSLLLGLALMAGLPLYAQQAPDSSNTQQPAQTSPSTSTPDSQQPPSSTPDAQQPPSQAPAPGTQTPSQSSPSTPDAQQPTTPSEKSQMPSDSTTQSATTDKNTFTGTIVKSGDKYVLQDAATGTSYDVDHQDEVKKFEGKKVRVHGTLDPNGKMIHLQ